MNVVRLVSLVLILSVAGLSSSFALCVSACTDETPSADAAHACHDQRGGVSMAAGDGTCPHGPAIVPQGDITRDDRAPLSIAQPVGAFSVMPVRASNSSTRVHIRPPDRPVVSAPILRV